MAMKEEALSLLREQDSFAAVAFLAGQADPLQAMEAWQQVLLALYWEEKDVPAFVALARAAVQFGLAAAQGAEAETAYQLRSRAKAAAYNLAAFTWPGWDDAGITLSPSDMAQGLDGARANLRLARELDKGPLALCRAHWVLGAHFLARGELPQASGAFEQGAASAAEAGEAADEWLCRAYAALAGWLADRQDGQALAAWETARQHLAAGEEGAFFLEQLDTARRVFGGS